jgi:hypothetical protein
MSVREIDPNDAVEYIIRAAPQYAKARAERVYIEEFRKTKKALLMKEVAELPLGAQEREAYASPEYDELLKGLRVAVEEEEMLKWMLVAAQARIDVYRTMEASNRNQDRAAR